MLLNQLNRRKPLCKRVAFLIVFVIVNSLGLTAVRSNESIQPIGGKPTVGNLPQPVDIKSSDRAFRSFRSIVDRYDCLSPSAETRFNQIQQIDSRSVRETSAFAETLRERNKFAKDLNACTDRIKNIAGIAPADLETLRQCAAKSPLKSGCLSRLCGYPFVKKYINFDFTHSH